MNKLLIQPFDSPQDYTACWQSMKQFTQQRDQSTPDQLWLLEHPSVFTQGQAGKPEHLLDPGKTPVVQTDRGGQVTWHGPGQTIVYLLCDLKRLQVGVRELVDRIEQSVVDTLIKHNIDAYGDSSAHGVYVAGEKICSLGLRVKRGCSYHGLALNIDANLSAFSHINPCGYPGLRVTSIAQQLEKFDKLQINEDLTTSLAKALGYQQWQWQTPCQQLPQLTDQHL